LRSARWSFAVDAYTFQSETRSRERVAKSSARHRAAMFGSEGNTAVLIGAPYRVFRIIILPIPNVPHRAASGVTTHA